MARGEIRKLVGSGPAKLSTGAPNREPVLRKCKCFLLGIVQVRHLYGRHLRKSEFASSQKASGTGKRAWKATIEVVGTASTSKLIVPELEDEAPGQSV